MTAIRITGILLFVLWGSSFGLSYVDLGRAALPLALAIAAGKAMLVALFFMELAHAKTSVRLAAMTAVLLVGTLLALVVMDVLTR